MEETTEEKRVENGSFGEGLLSQDSEIERQNMLPADLKVPQSPLNHTTKSTFGAQLYFNAELAKSNSGHNSPGPVYELNSSLGKQCKSTNESPPEVHFGFANRFIRTRRGEGPPGPGSYNTLSSFGDQTKYGVASPGPSICDQRSSVGTQVHSKKKTAPKTFFCSENRFKHDFLSRTSRSPATGHYESTSAVGKQPESGKITLPSYSLLGSNREQRAKVFISMEHDKALYGEASPGPAANFRLMSSLGYQPDSRKLSGSCWGFGFAPRFKPHNDENPGPGAYDC